LTNEAANEYDLKMVDCRKLLVEWTQFIRDLWGAATLRVMTFGIMTVELA
jgi:hypothetical protein